jgi:uncharacterized membrane protein
MSECAMADSRLVRLVVVRRRLLISIVSGIALGWALPWLLPLAMTGADPTATRLSTRLLAGWDLTAFIYVAFALRAMRGSTVANCRQRAALYDEKDWAILVMIVAASAMSFVAIVAELAAIKANAVDPVLGFSVAVASVALSWAFVHVVFTLHYANLYYRPLKDGHPGGLKFPGAHEPTYADFLYYSFVIGCAAQTADVATVSPEMRRLSLIHGIVAFAFNTTILALMINIGASLIQR